MCFSNATHYLFFELTVGCQPTLGHSQGVSLTNPMLIAAFLQYRPEGHQEPWNKIVLISLHNWGKCSDLQSSDYWKMYL